MIIMMIVITIIIITIIITILTITVTGGAPGGHALDMVEQGLLVRLAGGH